MWIAIAAWAFALAVAVVVLGFAGYELWWKSRRLQADMQHLLVLGEGIEQLQIELVAAQERLFRPVSGR